MKYYTLDWWLGSQDPGSFSAEPHERWVRRYEQVRGRLTPGAVELQESNLHDGRVREITTDVAVATAVMVIDTDDNGKLRRLRVRFTGVISLEFACDPERGLLGPHGFGDLGYWETEPWEDRFEFRALFSSGVEMRVPFGDVEVEAIAEG